MPNTRQNPPSWREITWSTNREQPKVQVWVDFLEVFQRYCRLLMLLVVVGMLRNWLAELEEWIPCGGKETGWHFSQLSRARDDNEFVLLRCYRLRYPVVLDSWLLRARSVAASATVTHFFFSCTLTTRDKYSRHNSLLDELSGQKLLHS
jgi:hypothetical protein